MTWTTPVPGREKQCIDYGREVDEFWGKQAADGRCSEPEWLWASRGSSLWIVKGDVEQLLGLQMSPENQRLINKGRLLCQDFEYDLYVYGREEVLGPFEEMAKEMHFA
ncbi:MAG TPA: hypothetical protein VFM09_07085 [Marmoricola sp.]|nr:hypothetical protein [Marmoricola sp.]